MDGMKRAWTRSPNVQCGAGTSLRRLFPTWAWCCKTSPSLTRVGSHASRRSALLRLTTLRCWAGNAPTVRGETLNVEKLCLMFDVITAARRLAGKYNFHVVDPIMEVRA